MATQDDIRELARAIGRRVQTRRKALGLTQERLAELADLSPTFIAKLEVGSKSPSLGTIIDMAAALDLDPADLVGGSREEADTVRVDYLRTALQGLGQEDAAFIEEELLRLASYLRRRGREEAP